MSREAMYISTELSQIDKDELEAITKRKVKLESEINALKVEIEDITNQLNDLHKQMSAKPEDSPIRNAILKFNQGHASEAIELAVSSGCITNDPASIAEFFTKQPSLDKVKLGEFLGKPKNEAIIQAYMSCLDFSDKAIVEALRSLFKQIIMPGEGQVIDRYMSSFGKVYLEQNPKMSQFFNDTDACFFLGYAIIMLNTTLHNASVPQDQAITLDKFKKMTAGQNGEVAKGDFDADFLAEIHQSVVADPFLINQDEVDVALTHIVKDGYLNKQGGRFKSWHKRWFVLSPPMLYYFESTNTTTPKGIIPLENIGVRPCEDASKQFCFEIYSDSLDVIKACKHEAAGKIVQGHHNRYVISAASHEERQEWIALIKSSIKQDLFHELLKQRKLQLAKRSSATNNHLSPSATPSSNS